MPFPYRDPQQAEPFVLGYFERLRANDDIRRSWLGLDALVQVRLQEPDLTLTLTADSFHGIYAGQLNVFTAFADRRVRAEGNAALVMQTAWTLPQAIRIYREHCASAGLATEETRAPGAAAAFHG
jgi:hypothetical protein